MSRRETRLLMLCLFYVAGCSKAPPPPPRPPQRPNPVPAAAHSNAATESAPAASKEARPARSGPKSSLPPNTDPKTVYVVGQIGETVTVTTDPGSQTRDRYQVVAARVGFTSENYSVTSAQPSTFSPPQFGSGQSKAGLLLPKGFAAIASAGYSDEGLPLRIKCEKNDTELALVSTGSSTVGSDDGPPDCKPAFKVHLESFYMQINEVTVGDFEKYRAEMKEKKKLPPAPGNADADPDFPVLGVAWAQAQAYARWARMDLPTEAEFEKASRGPAGLRTPWGEGKPLWSNRVLGKIAAYRADTSPYGIVDLAGNAREWCIDAYSDKAHAEAYKESSTNDLTSWSGPKNSKTSNLRVVKGDGPDWSLWFREGKELSKGHADVGFRCVLHLNKHKDKERRPQSEKAF